MKKTAKSEGEKDKFGISFRLTTDVFKQETSDLNLARKSFEKIKRAKMQERTGFAIKLEEKTEKGWIVIEEVKIKDSFFED